MTRNGSNNPSTLRRGSGVDKKPLTEKQKEALAAGRKSYRKGEERAVINGRKGADTTNERLSGEKLIRRILALSPKDKDEVADILAKYDLDPSEVSIETQIHIAAIGKAKDGDMAAYEKVLKAAGYLKDKVEASISQIPDPTTIFEK